MSLEKRPTPCALFCMVFSAAGAAVFLLHSMNGLGSLLCWCVCVCSLGLSLWENFAEDVCAMLCVYAYTHPAAIYRMRNRGRNTQTKPTSHSAILFWHRTVYSLSVRGNNQSNETTSQLASKHQTIFTRCNIWYILGDGAWIWYGFEIGMSISVLYFYQCCRCFVYFQKSHRAFIFHSVGDWIYTVHKTHARI